MHDITLPNIRAWVGEFFTPGQLVGTVADGEKCVVANYLKDRYKLKDVRVSLMTYSYKNDDGYNEIHYLPPSVTQLIARFDAAPDSTKRRASTILRIIKELEADEASYQAKVDELIEEEQLVGA